MGGTVGAQGEYETELVNTCPMEESDGRVSGGGGSNKVRVFL